MRDSFLLTPADYDLAVSLAGCSLDSSPGKNWVEEEGGLPESICRMAKEIMQSGKSKSSAIAIAVSRAKRLAATSKDAKVRAKYARAVAQWEKMKVSAKADNKISATNTIGDAVVNLSVLNAERRKKLKSSDFAIPEKEMYPIHDEAHARNALARVSQFGTPEEKARVRAAVKRRYPNIDVSK